MAAAHEIEFNVVAKDNASAVFRRIRREVFATGLVLSHPLLVLALLMGSILGCGILLGLLITA